MTMRLGVFAVAALLLSLWAGPTGCAQPYSGKPERLQRMKKKKRPEKAPEEASKEVVWDDQCRVNFMDDKPPKRRHARSADSLAKQAGGIIDQAMEQAGEPRIRLIIDAINKLKSALLKDQFSAEATYKMAVAYTLVRKKGCALQLLQRLQDLQKMPEVAREAELAAQRATRDPIFDPFRKEADAAVGL